MLKLHLENKAIGVRPVLNPGQVARRCCACRQLFAVDAQLLEHGRAPEKCPDCRGRRTR